MKRVGGKVTWRLDFAPDFAGRVRSGAIRQAILRCSIVEAGDTARLAAEGAEPHFREVEITRAWPLQLFAGDTALQGKLCGNPLTRGELDAVARAEGFADAAGMAEWLQRRGKMPHGIFDGQLVQWDAGVNACHTTDAGADTCRTTGGGR